MAMTLPDIAALYNSKAYNPQSLADMFRPILQNLQMSDDISQTPLNMALKQADVNNIPYNQQILQANAKYADPMAQARINNLNSLANNRGEIQGLNLQLRQAQLEKTMQQLENSKKKSEAWYVDEHGNRIDDPKKLQDMISNGKDVYKGVEGSIDAKGNPTEFQHLLNPEWTLTKVPMADRNKSRDISNKVQGTLADFDNLKNLNPEGMSGTRPLNPWGGPKKSQDQSITNITETAMGLGRLPKQKYGGQLYQGNLQRGALEGASDYHNRLAIQKNIMDVLGKSHEYRAKHGFINSKKEQEWANEAYNLENTDPTVNNSSKTGRSKSALEALRKKGYKV